MGDSYSKNVSDNVIEAVTNVSTDIVNDMDVKSGISQGIIVKKTKGDVNISGNIQSIKYAVDMKAVLKSMVTSTAQQKLTTQLTQAAKSVTKGINLFNFSEAENYLSLFLTATINMSTSISQTCLVNTKQDQLIYVEETYGKVDVTNNIQSSMSNIIASCYQDQVTNNKAVQDIQTIVDQTASAKTEGFSIWALVILALLCCIAPCAPVIMGASTFTSILFKIMFPVMLIVGVILLIMYFLDKSNAKTNLLVTMFSKGIKDNSSCDYTIYNDKSNKIYNTPQDAASECRKNDNLQGFDWIGYTVNNDGSINKLDKPKTIFFTYLDPECKIQQDENENLYKTPQFSKGNGKPQNNNADEGDWYIDTSTGFIYIFQLSLGWTINNDQKLTADKYPINIILSDENPSSGIGSNNDYYLVTENPTKLSLYLKSDDQWELQSDNIDGPGYIAKKINNPNTSGVKVKEKISYNYLAVGIGLALIGCVGTGYTLFSGKKSSESK